MPDFTGLLQECPPCEQGGREKRSGQFKPGASGNPAGRPPGARNKISLLCQEMLDGDAETLMRVLVKKAKRGDAFALRLVVDRLLPRGRAGGHPDLELPAITKASDIVAAWSAVITAAGAGHLTLDEAQKFGQILEGQRKALETSELEVRIAALEVESA